MAQQRHGSSERSPSKTPIVELVTCDSTNTHALRLAAAGGGADCWITAEEQTAGRGRSGRTWISPPGNLYATRLIHLSAPPRVLPQLSLLAGVALHDAILAAVPAVAPESLRLKWPNDVLLQDAKLAGILIESTTSGATVVAAVGIGVNITAAPPGLAHPAAALADHGFHCERLALLRQLDQGFERWLPVWSNGNGFAAIREAWLARAIPRTRMIRVHMSSKSLEGIFDGIDAEGALSLRLTDGSIVRVTFGDVEVVAGVSEPTSGRTGQQD